MNNITISNKSIERKIYNNEPVVTFKDIDLVHERPEGTASRNFRTNKKHFIENVDFYYMNVDKCKNDEIRRFGIDSPRGGYLFTESGYLMLVKSFTDDLAWEVQRQLVNSYFRLKEEKHQQQLPPYELKKKTYKGEPVMVTRDIEFLSGNDKSTINFYIRENNLGRLLSGRELNEFKFENEDYHSVKVSMNILYKSDVVKMLDYFYRLDDNKSLVDEYFKNIAIENKKAGLTEGKKLIKLIALGELKIANIRLAISKEMKEEITYAISKEYVKLGFLDKPCYNLDINSREGWNLNIKLDDYYWKVKQS